jgi:pentatricopeptide repeat protein
MDEIVLRKNLYNQDLLCGAIPYNEILACLCKCSHAEAAVVGEDLLQRMMMIQDTSFTPKSSKLCIFSFNAVLSCWKNALASSSSSPTHILSTNDIETRVVYLWEQMRMIREDESRNYKGIEVIPNRITVYTSLSILRSIARFRSESHKNHGSPEISYYQAKRILENMIQLYQQQLHAQKTILPAALQDYSESGVSSNEHAWRPTNESFHMLFTILGYMDDKQRLEIEANELLHRMKQLAQDWNEEDLYPDLLIYKTVIGLLLRSTPSKKEATKVERSTDTLSIPKGSGLLPSAITDIVHEAVDRYGWAPVDNKGDEDASLSAFGHFLIVALANSGYPEDAYEILQTMLEEYHRLEDPIKASRAKPNVISWNAVMSSFAQKGQVDRAVHVLHEIQDYHAAGHDDIRPDNFSLSILLKMMLQQKDPAIGDKAVLILERMEEKAKNGYVHLKPDVVTYAAVIECVLKSRTDKAIEKARDILIQRITEYKSGVSDVRPDCRLFKRVSVAILDHYRAGPFHMIEVLLSQFESGEYIHLDDASEMLECYVTLLHRYCIKAGSSESLYKAEKLLTRLEELHQKGVHWIYPRTKHYNLVLDALAKESNPKATKLAKDLLSKMEHRFETGLTKIMPDSYSYSAVLLAIANGSLHSSRALEAETLLQHILYLASIPGEERLSVQLTPIMFNNAIRAVERSGASDKAAKVRKILEAMIHKGVTPDTFTYNGAIRSSAYTTGADNEKHAAFDYALSCLHQLRSSESAKVDLYTYPAIFIACDRLLSNTDDDLKKIKDTWRMCCEDGYVSDLILSQLKKMKIPRETMAVLLQSEDPMSVGLASLPKRWTRLYHRRTKSSHK